MEISRPIAEYACVASASVGRCSERPLIDSFAGLPAASLEKKRLLRCAAGRKELRVSGELVGEVSGVGANAGQETRLEVMHPVQAEEVDAWYRGHATALIGPAVFVEDG